jgi:hypothetical protein
MLCGVPQHGGEPAMFTLSGPSLTAAGASLTGVITIATLAMFEGTPETVTW